MNTRTLYFIKHIALVAVFALGLVLVPTGTALAQKGLNKEVATPGMLSYALNLKSLSDVAVYSETAIEDKGASTAANGFRMAGASRDGASRKDLADVFSAINQLPCTQIADADLSGKTYGPGVYCLASAELASRLTLDGQNNAGSIFVFRVGGTLNTKAGSSIGLENGAQAGNVYFAMEDSAQIAEGTDFKGNVLARNAIGVGADAMVDGRVLSVKGDVTLSGNSILGPQQTGVIEICKALADVAGGPSLANRIFRFQIGSLITEVPAGQCSGPIVVATGTQVIQELQQGRTTDGGTFNGNFQLTNVQQLTNLGQPNTTALISANLPLFQATVNVVAGDIGSQTRIQFTNRFAIVAILEICKEGIDSGVTGFFNFTIDGLTQGLGQPGALVQYTIPVGQCTGPIAVTVPANDIFANPRFGTATVREQPRTGFIFTSATTAVGATPTTGYNPFVNRLVGFNVLGNGGGDATVTLVTGSDNGDGTGAGAIAPTAVQTTVFFNNRTAPGQLKVCKVAGPGIAELTPFTFEVQGVVPFDPVTVDTTVPVNTNPVLTSGIATTQNPSQGILRAAVAPITVGAVQQGGTVQNRTLTVLAGPASNPGGFCQIVDRTFLVDTAVAIRETGPTTVTIVNAAGSSTGVTGQVRVSRIRSSTGILSTLTAASNLNATTPAAAVINGPVGTVYSGSTQPTLFANPISGTGTTQPNVNFFPLTGGANTGTVTGAVVPIRRGVTEVEFVNVAFSPVPLKICKVAGAGVTPNTTSFNFTVTADTAGGLLAPFSSSVNVIAGPAAVNPGDQNGFCDFVPGPFGGAFLNGNSASLNGLTSFNFNSNVTVTETAATGFAVAPNGITSPTSGVITNITNRTANFTNLVNGVNEVQFVNQATTNPLPKPGKKTRFF